MTTRLACVIACASACYSPNPSVGARCAAGDLCPSGLRCVDGFCVEGGGSSDVDSGSNGSDGSGSDAACMASGAPTPAQLTSPLGSNNQDEGNMFDVVAQEQITITGFESHVTAGTTDYEIWTRPGTYVGFEGASTGWTRVGTATLTGLGGGKFTAIPIAVNVTLAAGERRAFYLTNHVANNRYHNGTQVGAMLASTAELTLYEGAGVNFGSTGFAGINTPRSWEGKIHYRRGGGATLATAMTGAQASDGVMFSVTPARDLELSLVGVNLEAGAHDVSVYAHRGPYAGVETDASQWMLLGSAPGVMSTNAAISTPLPIALALVIGAGTTTSIYVASQAMPLRSDAAGANPAASNPDLSIGEGVAVTGMFASAGGAVTPNVELGYAACN